MITDERRRVTLREKQESEMRATESETTRSRVRGKQTACTSTERSTEQEGMAGESSLVAACVEMITREVASGGPTPVEVAGPPGGVHNPTVSLHNCAASLRYSSATLLILKTKGRDSCRSVRVRRQFASAPANTCEREF